MRKLKVRPLAIAVLLSAALGFSQDQVRVSFGAVTRDGEPVKDLQLSDLEVRDKSLAGLNLTSSSNKPLRLCILIDSSHSTQNQIPAIARAVRGAGALAKFLLPGDGNQGCVIGFAAVPALVQPWTNDPVAIVTAAKAAFHPQGATAIYDALVMACEQFESSSKTRNVLLLISDGDDNSSIKTRDQMLSIVESRNAVIFVMQVPDEGMGRKWAGRSLQQMAAESGGLVFGVSSDSETIAAIKAIAALTTSQYELSFNAPDAKRHSLKIKPINKDIILAVPDHYGPSPLRQNDRGRIPAPVMASWIHER